MNLISMLGRILFGGFFAYNGINHLISIESMSGYAASKGVPMPTVAVIGSGLLLLVGGALILVGWKIRVGAWLVVLFLIPTTFIMHQFWAVDEAQRMSEMTNFSKNLALLGAAFIIATVRQWPAAIEKQEEDWETAAERRAA